MAARSMFANGRLRIVRKRGVRECKEHAAHLGNIQEKSAGGAWETKDATAAPSKQPVADIRGKEGVD